jgi:type II secretory pathway component PulC
MRLRRRDFPWVIILGVAVLFFLNIFIIANSQKYKNFDKQTYLPPELSTDNKSLIRPLSQKNNAIIEDKENYYLPFTLLGTIIGNPSLAFIYNSNTDKHRVYKPDDSIDDYKILVIKPGKVILEKNSDRRELLLASGSRKYMEDRDSVISIDVSGTMLISRVGIISVLPQANELLRKVKILPVSDVASNKPIGFRIDNVPAQSIIEEAGIKSGDIIHSVEGKNLESIKDAMQMFNTVRKQSSFEVVLLRSDKPLTLRYEFRN